MEKRRQELKGIKCSVTIDGYSDFIFLDNKGKPFHYKKLNHRLARISEAIDQEIKSKGTVNGLSSFPHVHSHMLRHTFATRMREAGADIKATADIMGHTEVWFNNKYLYWCFKWVQTERAFFARHPKHRHLRVKNLPKNLPKKCIKMREFEWFWVNLHGTVTKIVKLWYFLKSLEI